MRIGRILLAGLAPFVSLSAFAASLAPEAVSSKSAQHVASADLLPRLLEAVAPGMIGASDSLTPTSADPSPAHSFFALQALSNTALSGSLWMLSSLVALNLLFRHHPRALLRR